jgi:hypothetical protein
MYTESFTCTFSSGARLHQPCYLYFHYAISHNSKLKSINCMFGENYCTYRSMFVEKHVAYGPTIAGPVRISQRTVRTSTGTALIVTAI